MPGVLILTQSTTLIGRLRHNVRLFLFNPKRRRLVGRHLRILLIQVQGIVFHGIREEALFSLKYLGLELAELVVLLPIRLFSAWI